MPAEEGSSTTRVCSSPRSAAEWLTGNGRSEIDYSFLTHLESRDSMRVVRGPVVLISGVVRTHAVVLLSTTKVELAALGHPTTSGGGSLLAQ
jgi:hypothetical protein